MIDQSRVDDRGRTSSAANASPYRPSRAFTREPGVSLTRYRNRVRAARALDRLETGEPDLAADLGFADRSHLCRTVVASRRCRTLLVEPVTSSRTSWWRTSAGTRVR